jgi:hypothetical protein
MGDGGEADGMKTIEIPYANLWRLTKCRAECGRDGVLDSWQK